MIFCVAQFLEEILGSEFILEQHALRDAECLCQSNAENVALKFKLQQVEFELENQKKLTRHFEGMSVIMTAEFKKARWSESRDQSVKLSAYFRQFNSEMKGFMLEKQKLMQRLSKIEQIVSSINVILK